MAQKIGMKQVNTHPAAYQKTRKLLSQHTKKVHIYLTRHEKIAKLRRRTSQVHFAKIHFGQIHFKKKLGETHFERIHFGKIHFWKIHFGKTHLGKHTLGKHTF